jgi:hypothetical protein
VHSCSIYLIHFLPIHHIFTLISDTCHYLLCALFPLVHPHPWCWPSCPFTTRVFNKCLCLSNVKHYDAFPPQCRYISTKLHTDTYQKTATATAVPYKVYCDVFWDASFVANTEMLFLYWAFTLWLSITSSQPCNIIILNFQVFNNCKNNWSFERWVLHSLPVNHVLVS